MTVMFNDRQEFLDELANDKDLVARNLVRVTPELKRNSRTPLVMEASLVATAQIATEVVCLRLHIGQMFDFPSDDKVRADLETERESLEQELHERGFDLRAGEFTEQVLAT